MEKGLKKKLYSSSIYQLASIEEYLEQMALKRLEFVKVKGMIMYFRECEPREIHYFVRYIDSAGKNDIRPDFYTREEISSI